MLCFVVFKHILLFTLLGIQIVALRELSHEYQCIAFYSGKTGELLILIG